MYTLGINAAFRDSAACLVQDGRIVAAVEEERLSRIRHAKRSTAFSTHELPFAAIDYCLRQAGLRLGQVDHVAYSFDPYLLPELEGRSPGVTIRRGTDGRPGAERKGAPCASLFAASIMNAPRHLKSGAPHDLRERFSCDTGGFEWHFVEHHLAHAASAYFGAAFDRSAVITMDGRAERAATSYWIAEGSSLRRLGEVRMPHSLGLLYEKITAHLGFRPADDEYRVIVMAPYGKPRFVEFFRDAIKLYGEGRYEVRLPNLARHLAPARRRDEPLEEVHFDIAHSLQRALEERVLTLCGWLHEKSGCDTLCMAGDVALNCVLNRALREHSPFKRIWVQPAAHDAGTALGAAMWVDANARRASRAQGIRHVYFGPSFSADVIEKVLAEAKVSYRRMENVAETADLLMRDKIIGWFQGAAEFGPHALGARSIFASAAGETMQARFNALKGREAFRPAAAAVMEEDAPEWFENAVPSPFMLFTFRARPERAQFIPAALHADLTARVQTVNSAQNPLLYELLAAFKRRSGVPLLIHTSFNVRSQPIVCSPHEALEAFFSCALDALLIGPFLLQKSARASSMHGASQRSDAGVVPLLG